MKTKAIKFYHEPHKHHELLTRYPLLFVSYRRTFDSRYVVRVCSWLILLFFVFLLFGCSSAPKPTGEVYADRNTALSQIDLANQAASRGRYNDALNIINEARRLAVSTDDPGLRVRTSIALGDVLFSLGDHDEAFEEWEKAGNEGEASGEPVLAALARIYTIRARLVLLANGMGTDVDAEDLRTQVNSEMAVFRNDEMYSAAAYITLGLAERALGRWAEAENAVKRALDIHEKNYRLEDAAYDWYLIASIRSFAGNYDGALEALGTAISFDRRSENGFGLASSWKAVGDVNEKANRIENAQAAWRRAAEIYRAIGLPAYAERIEDQL
jgi:tetratricopeptide (TPR) repeat protein